jgi:hypothetical protein
MGGAQAPPIFVFPFRRAGWSLPLQYAKKPLFLASKLQKCDAHHIFEQISAIMSRSLIPDEAAYTKLRRIAAVANPSHEPT